MSASITLTEARENLDAWIAASKALAVGQSYSVAGQTVTRADDQTVRNEIAFWRREVKALEAVAAGSKRGGVLTPNFNT